MKIISVDPFSRIAVTEFETPKLEFDDMYRLLSIERFGVKVDVVELVYLPNGDGLWIDEEGLFKDYVMPWQLSVVPAHKFVSPALIVGFDDEGDPTDAKTTLVEAATWLEI